MRSRFLLIRSSSYLLILSTVLVSLLLGDAGLSVLVGSLLLIGAAGGMVSLHMAWGRPFRLLYGSVTVIATFWAQLPKGTPFFLGWTVLLLGMASILVGGASMELSYLRRPTRDPGPGSIGMSSLRRTMLRIGTFMIIVTMTALLVVLGAFAFVLGTFPLWQVAISTALLVISFAYLVSKGAEAGDQSG